MDTKPNDGGPAFPRPGFTAEQTESQEGMSLRAYIAAQVIGPLIGSNGFEMQMLKEEIKLLDLPKFSAQIAVETADALIAELNKVAP